MLQKPIQCDTYIQYLTSTPKHPDVPCEPYPPYRTEETRKDYSSAPAHDEATLIPEHLWGAQCIPPSPGEVAVCVPDHEAAIQPPASVSIDLGGTPKISHNCSHQRPRQKATYIFFGHAHEAITWSYSTNEVELTPRGVALQPVVSLKTNLCRI